MEVSSCWRQRFKANDKLNQTINVRAGFLCNYEVLQLLKTQHEQRNQECNQLRQAKITRCEQEGRRPFAKEGEDEEIERIQGTELGTVSHEVRYLVSLQVETDSGGRLLNI